MKRTSVATLIFAVFVLFAILSSQTSRAVTFAVMGDSQDFLVGSGSFASAVKKIKKKKPRAVIAVGDLISDCYDDSTCRNYFNSWKSTASPILKKTYPAMGNHDRTNTSKEAAYALWQEEFNLPTNGPEGFSELAYSFNKGNSHFVILNSSKPNSYKIDSTQRAWLEQDLTGNSKKKYKFIFFHMPAFPVSAHIGSSLDVYPEDRNALWEILDRHNVTAVFNGHEHFFNRRLIDSSVFPGATNSIYQFTVGRTDTSVSYSAPQSGMSQYFYEGCHFVIVKTSKKSVKVSLYTASGKRLNTFKFRK